MSYAIYMYIQINLEDVILAYINSFHTYSERAQICNTCSRDEDISHNVAHHPLQCLHRLLPSALLISQATNQLQQNMIFNLVRSIIFNILMLLFSATFKAGQPQDVWDFFCPYTCLDNTILSPDLITAENQSRGFRAAIL